MHLAWWITLAASWTMTAVAAWAAYRLFVRNGGLLLRLSEVYKGIDAGHVPGPIGLPPGCVLHDFHLPTLDNRRLTLSEHAGRRLLLIYVDPDCPHSRLFLARLAAFLRERGGGRPEPIIVTTGDPHRNQKLLVSLGLSCPVVVQEDMELADLHAVAATPMAYLCDENGMTAGFPAVGGDAILRALDGHTQDQPASLNLLNAQITRRSVHTRGESLVDYTGLPVGSVAPDFLLPGPRGGTVSLREFRGRKVILLFVDPRCATSLSILRDLKYLEGLDDVVPAIVSRGALAENRRMAIEVGASCPFGIQRYWDTSRDYRLMATPAACLVNEAGVVAADVAVGRVAVLNLVRVLLGEKEVVAALA